MDTRQASMPASTIQKNIFLQRCSRFGRVCVYIFIGIILSILLLFSVAAVLLYQNPEALSNSLAKEIKERTGIETSFSSVDVTLLPLPALALGDVKLKHEQLELQVAYVTARPAILPLLKGRFTIANATLLRPHVFGKVTSTQSEVSQKNSNNINILQILQNAGMQFTLPSFLLGCDINILGGDINIEQENSQLLVDNVQAEMSIDINGIVNTTISFDALDILEDKKYFAQINTLGLSMQGFASNGNFNDFGFNLNTKMHIPNIFEKGSAAIQLNMQEENAKPHKTLAHFLGMLAGSFDISGNLMWHANPLPFAFAAKLQGQGDNALSLVDANVQLDKDTLNLNATLNNAFSNTPSLDGHIALDRLNLTQWFGFARNLPPGLQQSLSNITNGELRFDITDQGLNVPFIKASAVGANFEGHGGVSSWQDIIIKLDLTASELSLLKAFPETEGVEVIAPSFKHTPLTPIPGSEEAAQSTGPSVNYDINLSVKKLTTWNLSIHDIDFRCIPTELDEKSNPKNHPNAVLLDFNIGKFYGGRGGAKAILFRTEDKKSGYDITAILRHVNAKGPLDILAGREIMGGHLSLDTSFLSYGKNLGEFLINKEGDLTLRVDNGFFTSKEKNRTTFTQFNTAAKFSSKPLTLKMVNRMPEVLRYLGHWKASIERPDMHAETSLNGILTLVGKNYTDIVLDKINSESQLTITKDLAGIGQELMAHVSGKLSLDTTKSKTSIDEADASFQSFANTKLTGSIHLDYLKDLKWQAEIQVESNKFSELLNKISTDGIGLLPSAAPQNFKLQTKVFSDSTGLQLNNLKFSLDKMQAQGSIKKTVSKRPHWDIQLTLNLLDWDKLFPDELSPSKSTTSASKIATKIVPSKPWSLAWLRDNDASGQINIEILRLYKTISNNVSLPINMKDGVLNLNPIVGTFYGGHSNVIFTGKAVNDTLHIQGGIQVEKANMLSLSHDLKLETAIGGTGSIWLSAQGALTNAETILPYLDGTWRIKIDNGFLQSRNLDSSLSGSPTLISELHDAGPLSNGILHSKNLVIKGPNLSVTGSGSVNLVQSTLDMNLNASLSGLNNIGVHYYGSIDNPKRDIDTGSLIIGAISTLGTGFFDIIGGMFEGLFSLFSPSKQ